uniref:Uncharacterized protein n=1 Tax=Anguilla anguilla TaxID=7936 RepID=A0A0E9RUS8_ANGAN
MTNRENMFNLQVNQNGLKDVHPWTMWRPCASQKLQVMFICRKNHLTPASKTRKEVFWRQSP